MTLFLVSFPHREVLCWVEAIPLQLHLDQELKNYNQPLDQSGPMPVSVNKVLLAYNMPIHLHIVYDYFHAELKSCDRSEQLFACKA